MYFIDKQVIDCVHTRLLCWHVSIFFVLSMNVRIYRQKSTVSTTPSNFRLIPSGRIINFSTSFRVVVMSAVVHFITTHPLYQHLEKYPPSCSFDPPPYNAQKSTGTIFEDTTKMATSLQQSHREALNLTLFKSEAGMPTLGGTSPLLPSSLGGGKKSPPYRTLSLQAPVHLPHIVKGRFLML